MLPDDKNMTSFFLGIILRTAFPNLGSFLFPVPMRRQGTYVTTVTSDRYYRPERIMKRDMMAWESVDISDEEIRRQLNERPGGRRAGRGDSPYTQEFYEKEYGIGRSEE